MAYAVGFFNFTKVSTMYRTLMIAVAVLTFISDLAYKASLKLQEADDALNAKAEAVEDKAIEVRLDANDARLAAAFNAMEQAKERHREQVKAFHAEKAAMQAAHG